jgi:hypothetical protein
LDSGGERKGRGPLCMGVTGRASVGVLGGSLTQRWLPSPLAACSAARSIPSNYECKVKGQMLRHYDSHVRCSLERAKFRVYPANSQQAMGFS